MVRGPLFIKKLLEAKSTNAIYLDEVLTGGLVVNT